MESSSPPLGSDGTGVIAAGLRSGARLLQEETMLETGSEKPTQRPALRRRGTSAGISPTGSRSIAAA
jgi:hypothetical protein